MAIPESKKELIRDQLRVEPDEVPSEPTSLHIRMPAHLRPLLVEAAKARDLTLVSYSRRAVLAFVASDLGIDVEEVMRQDTTAASYGRRGAYNGVPYEERTFGTWRVGPNDLGT